MANAPRPGIDPKLVKELIDAAEEAADGMCDSLNLDWGVGNTECEDVNNLAAARNRLSAAPGQSQAGWLFLKRTSSPAASSGWPFAL